MENNINKEDIDAIIKLTKQKKYHTKLLKFLLKE